MTEAERAQIELFRRMTPQERGEIAHRLTAQAMEQVRRTIEREHPELGPWAQKVKLVELQYGAELARRFERWLIERGLLTP